MRIADAEGLEAVSMRRVAVELGSGAASLYRYVAKKDELFDLMVDIVIGEEKLPRRSGHWRADLRKIAYLNRSMILRHPWMIATSAFRSAFGPNTLRWLEFTLKIVDGIGLDIDEMLAFSTTLFTFARGYAAGEIAEQETSRRSGMSREQWMASRAVYTRAIRDSGKYPLVTRVIEDARAPHDPQMAEHGFAWGLDSILDGFAAHLAAKGAAGV
jgi:AcrR family transcriptional regulator